MKTSAQTIKRSVALNNKIDIMTEWRNILEKLKDFFTGTFESDWEEKTSLNWQEWGRFPYIQ